MCVWGGGGGGGGGTRVMITGWKKPFSGPQLVVHRTWMWGEIGMKSAGANMEINRNRVKHSDPQIIITRVLRNVMQDFMSHNNIPTSTVADPRGE